MYIQITTRCNMRCAHCAFNCTEQGEDMSLETYRAALKLVEGYDDYLTVGGGEPTVHPLFWDFIGLGIVHTDYQRVYVITNGTIKESAFRLARLAQMGVMGAELSRDRFHGPIDAQVVEAFTRKERYAIDSRDLRHIRSVSTIINVGRAADTGVGTKDGCGCDDLFITPDGKLWACAHQDLQFGTVFKPEVPDDYWREDVKCSERMLLPC
jgi:hypothetical protein